MPTLGSGAAVPLGNVLAPRPYASCSELDVSRTQRRAEFQARRFRASGSTKRIHLVAIEKISRATKGGEALLLADDYAVRDETAGTAAGVAHAIGTAPWYAIWTRSHCE